MLFAARQGIIALAQLGYQSWTGRRCKGTTWHCSCLGAATALQERVREHLMAKLTVFAAEAAAFWNASQANQQLIMHQGGLLIQFLPCDKCAFGCHCTITCTNVEPCLPGPLALFCCRLFWLLWRCSHPPAYGRTHGEKCRSCWAFPKTCCICVQHLRRSCLFLVC